jgi:hypothetical protein
MRQSRAAAIVPYADHSLNEAFDAGHWLGSVLRSPN